MVLAVVVASCSSEPPPPLPHTLRVGIRAVGSLDPLAASAGEQAASEALVGRQVFEGLVRYDAETLEVRPGLAASWRASPDARTFTFVLRDGARFHNGRVVASSDVVWSLNRLARAACGPALSPIAGAPSALLSLVVGYAEVAGTCSSDTLAGVRAVGDRTVMVSLSEPWADFPSALGNPAAAVVPREEVEGPEGAFAARPVGTGAYRLSEAWDGRRLVLERFDDHWSPKPAVRTLEFVGYADDDAAYSDLLRGRLHYSPVPPSRVRQARRRFGDTGFTEGIGLYFFGFNLRSRRMAPGAFREGLTRAVDRASLATAIFEGTREAAAGLSSPALPGGGRAPCDGNCGFDVETARAKIAEAYPDGPPEIVIGTSDLGANPPAAEGIARMFAAAGVTARVVQRPFREHLLGIQAGDVDLFQLGWIPDYPALDGLLWPLFRSSAQSNYMGYSNTDVDRLLREARATVDAKRRADLSVDAEARALRDLPVLPLLWYRSSVAADTRLTVREGAVLVDGLGLTDFGAVSFGPPGEAVS